MHAQVTRPAATWAHAVGACAALLSLIVGGGPARADFVLLMSRDKELCSEMKPAIDRMILEAPVDFATLLGLPGFSEIAWTRLDSIYAIESYAGAERFHQPIYVAEFDIDNDGATELILLEKSQYNFDIDFVLSVLPPGSIDVSREFTNMEVLSKERGSISKVEYLLSSLKRDPMSPSLAKFGNPSNIVSIDGRSVEGTQLSFALPFKYRGKTYISMRTNPAADDRLERRTRIWHVIGRYLGGNLMRGPQENVIEDSCYYVEQ